MTPDDLAALAALADAATPGPWTSAKTHVYVGTGAWWEFAYTSGHARTETRAGQAKADAAFIAAARQAVPDLLDALVAAEAKIAEWIAVDHYHSTELDDARARLARLTEPDPALITAVAEALTPGLCEFHGMEPYSECETCAWLAHSRQASALAVLAVIAQAVTT